MLVTCVGGAVLLLLRCCACLVQSWRGSAVRCSVVIGGRVVSGGQKEFGSARCDSVRARGKCGEITKKRSMLFDVPSELLATPSVMCTLLVISFALWMRARNAEKARLQGCTAEVQQRHRGGQYQSVDTTIAVISEQDTSAAG